MVYPGATAEAAVDIVREMWMCGLVKG
jgi:hypothetical protein